MKNDPSQRRSIVAWTLVAALTAFLLTACSFKPPGCADEQTVGLAKEIVLDKWKWLTSERQDEAGKQDIARYTGALKIEIQNIVSDGYNAEALKQPPPQPSQETPRVESQGPSFDCVKAATAVERAICGDPKLAELDVAVVSAYNVALSKLPNKQDARTEQGMWMRQVRNACA